MEKVALPMETGQTVTDVEKRTWTVGQRLGRGLWGSSFVVRGPDERERVLKIPHTVADFPSDAPVPASLVKACAEAAREQAALLAEAPHPFLPRLQAHFDLPDGRPVLLLPRYPTSLRRKLDGGLGLGDTLGLALAIAERLATLARAGRAHGDLRPSNVLLNDRGEPVLADLLTPALHSHWRRLAELASERRDYHPPEADAGPPTQGWDTWALCLVVFESAMRLPEGGDPRHAERLAPPTEGLDKLQLATLRDRALARLQREGANARFVARVADRLATLLNRGITQATEPSPPYRFEAVSDLEPRLAEVAALVHPKVEDVGRLLLAASAPDGVFQGGTPVEFSVTVGTTEGVTDHEHLACGVQILDLDATGDDARVHVPDTRYAVQTHPSGRLRFQFTVPDLPPGRYKARIAFAVRDSGEEPQVAEGEFEVRPPPGYVPPAPEPETQAPAPLSLDARRREIEDEDAPIPVAGVTTAEGDASEVDAFPTPIAPSSAEVDAPQPTRVAGAAAVVLEHEPTAADLPSMDAPPAPSSPTGDSAGDLDDDLADDLDLDAPTRPSDATPPPLARPAPTARVPARPDTPTPHAPPREVTGPGQWEDELPGPADDLDSELWVPGPAEGEDLPRWEEAPAERPKGFDASVWAERLVEIARRDAYAVFLVILAGVLGVLFLLALIVPHLL